MITAAGRMLWQFGKGALRQTKHLSPFKRSKPIIFKKGTAILKKGPSKVGGKELRPWASGLIGQKGLLKKAGLSATKRRQALYGYQRGYKHLAKHKKLYGSGVAGAAAWDFLPGKDNPKV